MGDEAGQRDVRLENPGQDADNKAPQRPGQARTDGREDLPGVGHDPGTRYGNGQPRHDDGQGRRPEGRRSQQRPE